MVPAWSLPGSIRLSDALADGRKRTLERVPLALDDIAFLQYTGGTTGVAKGAMLLHRNIVANMLQARAWLTPFLDPSRREVIITPLPLYHIFSLTANCLIFMSLGGENVLIPNPRDIPGFVKEMAKYRFTAFTGVNTLFNALRQQPRLREARLLVAADHARRRHGRAGGGREASGRQVTKVPLIEAYGLTETSPAATINPLDLPDYNGSIGLPIPSTEIVLRDDGGKAVAHRPAGRDLHPRAAGDGGLLEPPGRDGEGDRQGRLVRDRRHRRDGRARLRAHRRPQEGHDPGVGLQRVSERDRGRRRDAPAACSSARRSACRTTKSGEAVKLFVVKKDDALTAEDADPALPRAPDRLQGARATSSSATELPKTNVGKILRRELRDEAKAASGGRKQAA